MLSTNTFATAVAIHEAGYRWAAKHLGVKLWPTRLDRGLRRYSGDVINFDANVDAPETTEHMALVMLVGGAAVEALAPDHRSGPNDLVEGRELLWFAFEERHGEGAVKRIPSLLREYNIRADQLRAEAEKLVAGNRAKIAKTADALASTAADLTVTA